MGTNVEYGNQLEKQKIRILYELGNIMKKHYGKNSRCKCNNNIEEI